LNVLNRKRGRQPGGRRAMSGIIGYVGYRSCREVLCEGLRRLDHRGYDSAELAWFEDGHAHGIRVVGKLDACGPALEVLLPDPGAELPRPAALDHLAIGIGYTRWATHGASSERHSNPQRGPSGRIRIALDGIIENHIGFHRRPLGHTVRCSYETDAEALAHLLALNYDGDLAEAVRCSLPDLDGRFAFVAICEEEPDMLVGVRRECPLVLGVGDGEQFVASSTAAFRDYTHDVSALGNDQIAVLHAGDISVMDGVARPRRPEASRVG
jgi:glutamine---fructose-6-phosphate transaminase (isomerizing)